MDIATVYSLYTTLLEEKMTNLQQFCHDGEIHPLFISNGMYVRKSAMNNAARSIIYALIMNADIFRLQASVTDYMSGNRRNSTDLNDALDLERSSNSGHFWTESSNPINSLNFATNSNDNNNVIPVTQPGNTAITKIKQIAASVDPVTGCRLKTSRANFPISDATICFVLFLVNHWDESHWNVRAQYFLQAKQWLKTHSNTGAYAKLFEWAMNLYKKFGVVCSSPNNQLFVPQVPHKIPQEGVEFLRDCVDALENIDWPTPYTTKRQELISLNHDTASLVETYIFYYPCLRGLTSADLHLWLIGVETADQLYEKYKIDAEIAESQCFDWQ